MQVTDWQKISSQPQYQCNIFSIRKDRSRSPNSGREHDFDVLESCDWINIIALTEQDDLVLIRQYRHGTEEITTEIPGGMVEPGEEPLAAAKRELAEETGYQADDWQQLGLVEPNPAFQNNTTYTFLARNACQTSLAQPDENEEIEVVIRPLSEIWSLIDQGIVKHALVLCAFFHLVRAQKLSLPGA